MRVSQCVKRNRHREFIRFLTAIERAVAAGRVVHVILDNYGALKRPEVLRWLNRHPRFVFHWTPTSCSWLEAVEGIFSRLTWDRVKRGVFRSIIAVRAAIHRHIKDPNGEPKPFVWTADPDGILD